jgi:hypothetical protein
MITAQEGADPARSNKKTNNLEATNQSLWLSRFIPLGPLKQKQKMSLRKFYRTDITSTSLYTPHLEAARSIFLKSERRSQLTATNLTLSRRKEEPKKKELRKCLRSLMRSLFKRLKERLNFKRLRRELLTRARLWLI